MGLGVIVLGACFAGTVLKSSGADERSGVALVRIDPAEVDLGQVPWGTNSSHRVMLTNEAPHAIRVRAVEATCGCTTLNDAALTQSEIAPGASVPIEFNFRAGTIPGPKDSTIRVVLADGTQVMVDVSADIVGTWSVTPDRLDFATVSISGQAEKIVQTLEYSSDAHELVDVRVSGGGWLRVLEAPRGQRAGTIRLELDPARAHVGPNVTSLIVETRCDAKRAGAIPVRVKGLAPVVASASRVFLAADDQREISFTDAFSQPVNLRSAVPEHEALAADVRGSVVVLRWVSEPPEALIVAVTVTDEGGNSCRLWVSTS